MLTKFLIWFYSLFDRSYMQRLKKACSNVRKLSPEVYKDNGEQEISGGKIDWEEWDDMPPTGRPPTKLDKLFNLPSEILDRLERLTEPLRRRTGFIRRMKLDRRYYDRRDKDQDEQYGRRK